MYTTEPCSFCASRQGPALQNACALDSSEVNLSKDPPGASSSPHEDRDDELPARCRRRPPARRLRRARIAADRTAAWSELLRPERAPRARGARLAALAHVGPPPGDDHLDDRRPAAHARLARAQVHEELGPGRSPARRRRGGSRRCSPRARRCPRCSAAITASRSARTAARVSAPGRRAADGCPRGTAPRRRRCSPRRRSGAGRAGTP